MDGLTCVCAYRGVRYSYNFGCRCPRTVETVRRWNRKPKARGTQRSTGIRSPYVDEIAVEKALSGERVRLTIRERAIVVAKLTRWGFSANAIGERLGLAARTVQRYRAGVQKHGKPVESLVDDTLQPCGRERGNLGIAYPQPVCVSTDGWLVA